MRLRDEHRRQKPRQLDLDRRFPRNDELDSVGKALDDPSFQRLTRVELGCSTFHAELEGTDQTVSNS